MVANYWSAFWFAAIRAISVSFLFIIRVIRAIRGYSITPLLRLAFEDEDENEDEDDLVAAPPR